MLNIISLGAGVQSSTMALMAAHGEITPMPDCAIFADTQAETRKVYEWLDWLEKQLPFPVYRVTHGDLASDGLRVIRSKKSGKLYQKNLIPLFVLGPNGEKGILNRKCTAEYKVRELVKKARAIVTQKAIAQWRKSGALDPLANTWIGISTDEAHRMKPSAEPWIRHSWPLIDHGVSRDQCLRWMKERGYSKPPRSACVFCPYHSDNEWRRLATEEPQEFMRAVAWEKAAQIANRQDEVARGQIYLHASRIPLEHVDLTVRKKEASLSLFGNECEGMCGV